MPDPEVRSVDAAQISHDADRVHKGGRLPSSTGREGSIEDSALAAEVSPSLVNAIGQRLTGVDAQQDINCGAAASGYLGRALQHFVARAGMETLLLRLIFPIAAGSK